MPQYVAPACAGQVFGYDDRLLGGHEKVTRWPGSRFLLDLFDSLDSGWFRLCFLFVVLISWYIYIYIYTDIRCLRLFYRTWFDSWFFLFNSCITCCSNSATRIEADRSQEESQEDCFWPVRRLDKKLQISYQKKIDSIHVESGGSCCRQKPAHIILNIAG